MRARALALATVGLLAAAFSGSATAAPGQATISLVDEILPGEMTGVGCNLFFTSFDETEGSQLWTSDGTRAGTKMVSDLAPGNDGLHPRFLTNVKGTLFFAADDID